MSNSLQTIEPAHSEIGASSMHRWAKCPGSVRLSRGIQRASSSYADEGTLAHSVAAHILEKGTWPASVPFDEDMNAAISTYVSYIGNIIESPGFSGQILIEHRFSLERIHPGLFGTADCVIYDSSKKRLYVIDYKHGAGIPVDVEENEQLLYYGLGALTSFPQDIEEVVLTIVQPRCNHPAGPIRTWRTRAERVLDFAFHVSETAMRTQKEDAPLNPGEHCRFCPAVGVCPELYETAQAAAKREFGSHLSYDPKHLADTLEKLDAVEAWASGVRAFAYAELEHGREIPGWKLVQKRATRRWSDAARVKELIDKIGLTEKCTEEPSLKSVAQVEKAIGKPAFLLNLADFVVAESSGFAIAPESDNRPAAKMSAKDAFSKIPVMEEQKIEKLEKEE